MRGSDPDAALYYLARMFDAGEDPLFLARRVVRMAAEDIGLADPQALVIANAAKDAYDFLGSPEGELAIAEAVVYLATAPNSNAVYRAFSRRAPARQGHGSLMPPKIILNAPTKLMKSEGYGEGYINTITTSRKPSPARITGRLSSDANRSIVRSSAGSSARSRSASTIGRGCATSGGYSRGP